MALDFYSPILLFDFLSNRPNIADIHAEPGKKHDYLPGQPDIGFPAIKIQKQTYSANNSRPLHSHSLTQKPILNGGSYFLIPHTMSFIYPNRAYTSSCSS